MGGKIIDLLCRCFSRTQRPALFRQDTPHSWKSDRTETHYWGNSKCRGETLYISILYKLRGCSPESSSDAAGEHTPRGNTHPGEIKRTSAHTRLIHAYCDRYCDSRTDAHTDSVAPACHAHVHGHRNTYCCLHAQRLCAAMMPSTSMRYRGVPCMTCIREGSIPNHPQPSHEERGIMVACHPIHPTLETL